MKRLLNILILLCAAIGWSCAETDVENIDNAISRELTFKVESEGSRIAFAGGRYEWNGGEALGIYIDSALPTKNAAATVELRDGVGYCTISDANFATGDMMYGYYPYSRDNNTMNLGGVMLRISDDQVQSRAGEFNVENMPMVAAPISLTAEGQVPTVYMRSLGGIICFNIYADGDYAGEQVQSIYYTTDLASSGTFNFDLASAAGDELAIAGLGNDGVSLDLEEPYTVGTSLSAAQGIYMVIAPNAYQSGALEITTDKATYTYDYARTIERNKYYNVNINLSNATDRRALGEEVSEPVVATLTFDEASDCVGGYGNPKTYTNEYGEWIICAYKYASAFQLNGSKVAYIGTPQFSGKITGIEIKTVESYSNSVYVCTSTTQDTSVYTASGGGETTSIDVSDLNLHSLYIRSSNVMRISAITIICDSNAVAGEPKFAELKASVNGASSSTATDGSATIGCTITYKEEAMSLVASGMAYRLFGAPEYTKVAEATNLASPSLTISGLAAGTYQYYAYATMSNGITYESNEASFVIRDMSHQTSYRYGWFELPEQTDADENGIDDNNADYYYSHTFRADASTIRNFSACYSKSKIHPVWVAAPMHSCYLGSSGRNDSYRDDPNIGCTQSPKFTGYTRGHMVGSSDRTVSVATNKQAFYYSNIGAQLSSGFNTGGGAWNNLEDKVDGYLCADTLYQVIGCIFRTWTDKYGHTVSANTASNSVGTFQVPTAWYKVLLRTKNGNTGKRVDECSSDELQCVAFVLGHYSNQSHKPTTSDMYSVSEVEQLTGLTFFPNVPNAPKESFSSSDWGL